jgi:nitrite reductase/ring-hydroxylating ferredoxin subunit
MTLTRGIEQTLREHYPGFERIVAHAPEPELLQIETLRRPVFADAGALADLAAGDLRVVQADGIAVVLANVDGDIYALRDGCPVDGRTLAGGRLAGPVIVCPWHNCAYDARSGKRADDEPGAPGLAVIPVAVRDGAVQVAVNVA